jgi:hypothetical protein
MNVYIASRFKKKAPSTFEERLVSIESSLGKEAATRKIRVAFAVIYASAFPGRPLYDLMLLSKKFEPFIVLIPDALRSRETVLSSLLRQEEALGDTANFCLWGVDKDSGKPLDVFDGFDLVCFSTPYSEMTEVQHSIKFLSERGQLVFYVNYSFGVSEYDLHFLNQEHMGRLWKVFVPTKFHAKRWKKHNQHLSNRVIVSGYPKTDPLFSPELRDKKHRDPKRIILAPHHSVNTEGSNWSLGDFLELADRYAEIPAMYPNVHFILRPHPLLRQKLESELVWGKLRTSEYFNRLTSNPNLEIDTNGNYMGLFRNSDGMIHNSGSFLAEYLFTGKPTSFMMHDHKLVKKSLHSLGYKCLKSHYIVRSRRDLEKFMVQVIEKGRDQKKLKRARLVRLLSGNGPSSSSKRILEHLEMSIITKAEKSE